MIIFWSFCKSLSRNFFRVKINNRNKWRPPTFCKWPTVAANIFKSKNECVRFELWSFRGCKVFKMSEFWEVETSPALTRITLWAYRGYALRVTFYRSSIFLMLWEAGDCILGSKMSILIFLANYFFDSFFPSFCKSLACCFLM